MTISQAIDHIDGLIHNTYSQEDKVQWLSLVDASVKEQLIDTHKDPPDITFEGYGPETPMDTILLVPEPYSDLYVRWLESQIHYYNGEYGKYNQALSMYNSALGAYVNYYNRTHMPKGQHFSFF
jgi:hypothetical protein